MKQQSIHMAKITTTTTIAYLLIAAVAVLPPTKAPPSVPAPTPLAAPTLTVAAVSPPQLNCSAYLAGAGDCLDFVMNGSTLQKPTGKCCPEVANLTGTHPICLCELLFNSSQFDIPIDVNKAFKLPSLCNITTLHVNSCAALGVPVAIPSLAPAKAPGNEHNQHLLIGLLLFLFFVFCF